MHVLPNAGALGASSGVFHIGVVGHEMALPATARAKVGGLKHGFAASNVESSHDAILLQHECNCKGPPVREGL